MTYATLLQNSLQSILVATRNGLRMARYWGQLQSSDELVLLPQSFPTKSTAPMVPYFASNLWSKKIRRRLHGRHQGFCFALALLDARRRRRRLRMLLVRRRHAVRHGEMKTILYIMWVGARTENSDAPA